MGEAYTLLAEIAPDWFVTAGEFPSPTLANDFARALIDHGVPVGRTGILPRWVSLSGYPCAVVLLTAITSWPWIVLLFPCWMLLIGSTILVAEYRKADVLHPRPA